MARIVIATDLSKSSRPAFEAGIDLAKDLGTGVLLVHAMPPLPAGAGIAGAAVHRDVQLAREGAAMEDALAMSETLLQRARNAGVEIEGRIEAAAPADLILQAAREEEAPLIVVATHGRTGIARALMGSVAEDVIRHADRPVLVVPTGRD